MYINEKQKVKSEKEKSKRWKTRQGWKHKKTTLLQKSRGKEILEDYFTCVARRRLFGSNSYGSESPTCGGFGSVTVATKQPSSSNTSKVVF